MFHIPSSKFHDRGGFTPLQVRPPTKTWRQPPRGGLPVTGFTLIELLIVVAITALLSSFMLVYQSTGRQQVSLYVEKSKIAQFVLKSKSLAIATYIDPSSPVCGFGVHFDYAVSTYALFSYNAPNCNAISFIDTTDSANYKVFESFPLAQGLSFKDGVGKLDHVFFIPPDPTTLIWSGGVLVGSGSGNIYVATTDGTASITITVSTAGQVAF